MYMNMYMYKHMHIIRRQTKSNAYVSSRTYTRICANKQTHTHLCGLKRGAPGETFCALCAGKTRKDNVRRKKGLNLALVPDLLAQKTYTIRYILDLCEDAVQDNLRVGANQVQACET